MTRGVLSFVFDDGYTSILTDVVPLLTRYSVPGVFAVPLLPHGLVADGIAMTPWQQWLPLTSQGHEIAAHSRRHVDLTTLSPIELEAELAEPQTLLHATTLVYPGGAVNAVVRQATQRHYRAARTVQRGFEHLPSHDPWQLRTINWSQRNWSLPKANAFALWAWVRNLWLIETYHLVTDQPTTLAHTVPLREFARHLAFVARLPVAVKTIRDVTVV